MSLFDPEAEPISADDAVAGEFRQRFVWDAHRLVAEGYVLLEAATLTKKNEEAISGLIVDRINEWLDRPTAPAWTSSYFVNSEIPGRSGHREGKRRSRVDIFVESSAFRPRARFAFEAKRFCRSDSVAEYIGSSGLGAFLDGRYLPEAPAAGMLGFVQKGSNDSQVEKVRAKLDTERDSHGLAPKGAVWKPVALDSRLGTTWVSRHTRVAPLSAVEVYHSFLRCCASA